MVTQHKKRLTTYGFFLSGVIRVNVMDFGNPFLFCDLELSYL